MAERVGFEPTDPLRGHLISSQARSTELRHLSAEASKLAKGLCELKRCGLSARGDCLAALGAPC